MVEDLHELQLMRCQALDALKRSETMLASCIGGKERTHWVKVNGARQRQLDNIDAKIAYLLAGGESVV